MSDIAGLVELGDGFTHLSSNFASTYQMCRVAEKEIMKGGKHTRDLLPVRILGRYLLVFAPTDAELVHIANTIHSTAGYSAALMRLGRFYDEHWIRTCMRVPSLFWWSCSLVCF